MRLLLAALVLTASASAQSPQPPRKIKEELRFTLILSRHGVRSPLTLPATRDAYASNPWPAWAVPPGILTPHGAAAIRQMGVFLRADFTRTVLLDAATCPQPRDIYLYSDTDQRNIASTRATYDGFAPGCPALPVHTWVPIPGRRDPLFVAIAGGTFPPPPPEAALEAYRAALGSDPATAFGSAANPQLNRLTAILAPTRPAATPLLDIPSSIAASPTGDPMILARGPLPTASALLFNLLLEYVDGRPLTEVAWGRLGPTPAEAEAKLNPLIGLANKPFFLAHRTTFFARAESSNLLTHILDTLQQAAGTPAAPAAAVIPVAAARVVTSVSADPSPTVAAVASPDHAEVKADATQPATSTPHLPGTRENRINGAIGPAGTKIVYISAHDTNLVGVAGLLGLRWTADGRTGDTPPDSQLVFELWQAVTKHHKNPADDVPGLWKVRIRYRAQTLTQLRSAADLSPANPPAEVDLKPTGCRKDRCDLPIFLHAARATIDPAYTQLDVPPTQTTDDKN